MIHIQGDFGEGGGSILRQACGLSAITGKAIRITKIRDGRCNPGMQEQHLQAVKAVARLCNAETKGLELGSKELEFIPGKITKKQLKVEIKTAGSVGLVIQALLLPCFFSKHNIQVRVKGGGSFGKWSPNLLYFENVLFPVLKKIGLEVKMVINKHGMYPEGGADVIFKFKPCKQIGNLELDEQGELLMIKGISIASDDLRKGKVAERQSDSARRILGEHFLCPIKVPAQYVSCANTGSAIVLWAEFENCILGWDALGEKNEYSEKVGEEAAVGLLKQVISKSTVDEYLSDQILPFLCFAKEDSCFRVIKVSGHLMTNMWLLKKFVDVDFEVNDKLIKIKPKSYIVTKGSYLTQKNYFFFLAGLSQ